MVMCMPRPKRMKKYIVIGISIIIWMIPFYIYYKYNPTMPNWAVKCGFHELTSLNCPGCGGQRAIHALLHGHILEALRYNFIYVIGIPFFMYLYFYAINEYILKNRKQKNNFIFTAKFGFGFAIFIVTFFILRNIPIFPFTYLSPPI